MLIHIPASNIITDERAILPTEHAAFVAAIIRGLGIPHNLVEASDSNYSSARIDAKVFLSKFDGHIKEVLR